MGYHDKIDEHGPKKLLALDGGGVRGALTLEILAKIEGDLQARYRRGDDFRLCEYFDYIGGTSTGAIIAAGLARGMRVSELLDLYEQHGREMFDRAFIVDRYWRNKYESTRLAALLKDKLGDYRFGDRDALQTLLMMVLRNATTDSPWPLSNNPRARYNSDSRPDNNLNLPLWQLVRASTAAPTFFPPERIVFGQNVRDFIFVDGGMTMYNNPAFQLFLMATLDAYELRWDTGVNNMLIVSVGTGHAPKADDRLQAGEMNLLYNASSVPAALMAAALHEQDLLCRVFGRCLHGARIDSEVGRLVGTPSLLPEPLFTYVRYNAELTAQGLSGLGLSGISPDRVQRLDAVDSIPDLRTIGRTVAGRDVQLTHFTGFLDDAAAQR